MDKFPNFFQTYDEEDTKTPFCMHNVPFLFKNPSKFKIITDNIFLKNTYSRNLIPAKYFQEANSQK